jgi:carbon monoxide dehydrogenase subunit G
VKLDNSFEVSLPLQDTWELLQDLARIAPCLPGAHLDDVVDGEYRGGLSTKIGPINARYRGRARFLERDEVAHRAVIEAQGREERGSGTASATVTATLHGTGAGTRVDLTTDMAVGGRAAQFGRSLMAEVSSTLVGEFARRLEAMIGEGRGTAAPAAAGAAAPEAGSLDVGRTLLVPMLRRALVPAAAGLVSGLAGWWLGRRTARPPQPLA